MPDKISYKISGGNGKTSSFEGEAMCSHGDCGGTGELYTPPGIKRDGTWLNFPTQNEGKLNGPRGVIRMDFQETRSPIDFLDELFNKDVPD